MLLFHFTFFPELLYHPYKDWNNQPLMICLRYLGYGIDFLGHYSSGHLKIILLIRQNPSKRQILESEVIK